MDYQKQIVETIQCLTGKFSLWQIWQDFVIMSAISISNALNFSQEREKLYLERIGKYNQAEQDRFAEMLGYTITALDQNPEQDFLGELFMRLGIGNDWAGQFFTPYTVCQQMAQINCLNVAKEKEQRGWISVADPACGAGATLIAVANECKRQGINYQRSVLFVAQDIDLLAGCMCYIQLSLLGCPGYVAIGDTLTSPVTSYDSRNLLPKGDSNIWYTPMYESDLWYSRRKFAQKKLLLEAI